MLTATQKYQFETFGFLHLKNLIPHDEMQHYVNAFDDTMTKANGGVPWNCAPKNHFVAPFFRHNPGVYHQLLDQEILNEVVEDLLGEDYVFWVAEGQHRYGGSGWHHDSLSPETQTHIKVVFFLDAVRADTGCLRVIPCSHFPPMRDLMDKWYEVNGNTVVSQATESDTLPWSAAIALESEPGDAVIFNVKIHHAAVGDEADRRAIYINYVQKARTPDEEDYFVKHHDYDHPYYTPELFEDATPKRMRMLSYLKNLYDDLGEKPPC